MFWLGLICGIIGTVLLEFLYCALVVAGENDEK